MSVVVMFPFAAVFGNLQITALSTGMGKFFLPQFEFIRFRIEWVIFKLAGFVSITGFES